MSCYQHSGKKTDFYCISCNEFCCFDCFNTGKHNNYLHVGYLLEDAYNELDNKIVYNIFLLTKKKILIMNRIHLLASKANEIIKIKNKIVDEIESYYNNIKHNLIININLNISKSHFYISNISEKNNIINKIISISNNSTKLQILKNYNIITTYINSIIGFNIKNINKDYKNDLITGSLKSKNIITSKNILNIKQLNNFIITQSNTNDNMIDYYNNIIKNFVKYEYFNNEGLYNHKLLNNIINDSETLKRNIKNKLKICYFCGIFLDYSTINSICHNNITSYQSVNKLLYCDITETEKNKIVYGNYSHYWSLPKKNNTENSTLISILCLYSKDNKIIDNRECIKYLKAYFFCLFIAMQAKILKNKHTNNILMNKFKYDSKGYTKSLQLKFILEHYFQLDIDDIEFIANVLIINSYEDTALKLEKSGRFIKKKYIQELFKYNIRSDLLIMKVVDYLDKENFVI